MSRPILLLLAIALLAAAGCSSPREAKLRGVAPMNMNSANESVAVRVQFYFLTKPDAFQSADYSQLWTLPGRAKEVLGDEYLGTTEVTVPPNGELKEYPLGEISGEAPWIAILPRYTGTDGQPRTLMVPGEKIESLVIELTGYHIREAAKR